MLVLSEYSLSCL